MIMRDWKKEVKTILAEIAMGLAATMAFMVIVIACL